MSRVVVYSTGTDGGEYAHREVISLVNTHFPIEIWGKGDTFYEVSDRIPFSTYQGYCGIGPDGIRAWSSHPPGN